MKEGLLSWSIPIIRDGLLSLDTLAVSEGRTTFMGYSYHNGMNVIVSAKYIFIRFTIPILSIKDLISSTRR